MRNNSTFAAPWHWLHSVVFQIFVGQFGKLAAFYYLNKGTSADEQIALYGPWGNIKFRCELVGEQPSLLLSSETHSWVLFSKQIK